ncbi:hypothetical protein WJX74_002624 [Apatococcus lobatus]|uniref:Rhodanese domain-containing protein n=1 Tax=Apatococcus lobatus TaxID=904363 RepID=A0AAW1RYC1_9CHLO
MATGLARAQIGCNCVGRSLQSAPLRLSRPLQSSRSQRQQKRGSLCVRAENRYPDPTFVQETLGAFPDKGIANVEEARALFSEGGYVYLDVRPQLEYEEAGKVPGSVNIPVVNSKRKWDPEQNKKVFEKSDNPDFVKTIEKRYPDKETKFLVGCSDGRKYSLDALGALDEAGYGNLAGLKGGYYAWFRVFDNKLARRNLGEYQEEVIHGGDSGGIHASGAGFERVDTADRFVPPSFD